MLECVTIPKHKKHILKLAEKFSQKYRAPDLTTTCWVISFLVDCCCFAELLWIFLLVLVSGQPNLSIGDEPLDDFMVYFVHCYWLLFCCLAIGFLQNFFALLLQSLWLGSVLSILHCLFLYLVCFVEFWMVCCEWRCVWLNLLIW